MFLFKSKKVVVDCFTSVEALAREYPIKKSSHHVPEWWKQLETTKHFSTNVGIDRPYGTMKSCSGFVHLFRNSWTVPLWSDFKVRTLSNGEFVYVTPSDLSTQTHTQETIGRHAPDQFKNAFGNYIHLKFMSPWLITEKSGVNFAMVSADWTVIDAIPDFRIPVGFLNFKVPSAPNINLFAPRKEHLYEIDAGTPMVYLIPITERKVEFKTHAVSEAEYLRYTTGTVFYNNKFLSGVFKWD